jgi:hypothetical protein
MKRILMSDLNGLLPSNFLPFSETLEEVTEFFIS